MGIPFLFLKNTCGEPPLAGVAAGGNVAVTLTRPPKAWSLFLPGVARRLVVCIIFFFSIFLFPVFGFTGVVDETLEGDAKLAQGEIQEAEKHYATAKLR